MESPTHVGNTRCHRTMRWRTSAHPHACGEYAACEAMYESYRGSSPRVWGILKKGDALGLRIRFIPTRVGNTRAAPAAILPGTVHPHACGEYGPGRVQMTGSVGSSPRVWGIRQTAEGREGRGRFIPTRVGNTSKRS